ncbi:MAG: hypothetical protein IJY63_01130 [Clostridia bacterium]|nr:hypothetical protein [Clostridia bacterium]
MLPNIVQKPKMPMQQFPTAWQTVIFRNYGYVSVDKIAKTLCCDEETVHVEAARLGLADVEYDKNWEERGYLTLIRHNWYLLDYEQLTTLFGYTEEKLDFLLKEEDFLFVKLGWTKPACKKVFYSPLSADEIAATERIAKTVSRYMQKPQIAPFDFYANTTLPRSKTSQNAGVASLRLVHGYITPGGDAFSVDCDTYLTDELLSAYQAQGVNALWMHGLLSSLSYYPFKPSLCKGYEKRREELKRILAKCHQYGIKLYLYFNEPRCLPTAEFGKYAHLKGDSEGQDSALCFSKKETRAYLYNAFKDLLENVPELDGILTITMSENLTHCKSRIHSGRQTLCPICKDIPAYALAADVNNVIMQAIRDSGANTDLIANLWAWSKMMGFSEEDLKNGIARLDKDIGVLFVSEFDLEFEKGGVQVRLADYSISNPGPSEFTKLGFALAKEYGHKIYAKMQVCNSWECSCVPYLPVFDLVKEHLDNLSAVGVHDYMLSWTLGGYPAPNLSLVSAHGNGVSLDEWYREYYGENADVVHRGVRKICDGFVNYPFALDPLYNSPKTLGTANLWSKDREYNTSTMTCYSFDDYETWITPYPYETYISLFEKLLQLWQEGIAILQTTTRSAATDELLRMAQAAYLHLRSDYLHTKYAYLKREWTKNEKELREIIAVAREDTENLIALVRQDARIGFEASNQYYYADRHLIEKILNLDNL